LPQLAQLVLGAAQILRDHAPRYCFVFRLLALLVRTTALRLGPSAIMAAHSLASSSSTPSISGINAIPPRTPQAAQEAGRCWLARDRKRRARRTSLASRLVQTLVREFDFQYYHQGNLA
jgi:hypothetical protein